LGNNYFAGIKNVKLFEGEDGLIRYIYGEFSNISIAREELIKIKELGYEDAFIKNIETISGYN